MARSEPTHVALIAGGGQGLGTANPDPEVLYRDRRYSLRGHAPPLRKTSDEISDRSMTTSVLTASAEEILAATAHELRLPLSHIKGFVSSLQRTDVEWDEQTRLEFITEIDLATDHLTELVDELCTPRSAAERGLAARAPGAGGKPGPDMTFTEPAAVLEGALNRVGLPGKRPLRIDVPSTLPSIRMNASQMERVVVNLVENAIKYSPSGTPISVSARVTRDGELRLSVEDEGPGVPAADRERIFQPFFRNQMARKSNVPGHGLGMAICQSIVLAHGGRIEVTDRPGSGACFSVFLPALVQAGTRSGSGATSRSASSRSRHPLPFAHAAR
jgi:two-component system, OmpR family, sensor histidine kinase KdpD